MNLKWKDERNERFLIYNRILILEKALKQLIDLKFKIIEFLNPDENDREKKMQINN